MKFQKYDSYKDIGVEWLGEIPNDWGVARVKDIIKENIYGTSEITKESGKYEILGMGDIENGVITYPKKKFLDSIPKDLLLKKGDLLFNRTNSISLVGKVGFIDKDIKNISFASYLVRLRLKNSENKIFYSYFFNSNSFINFARANAIQTANQANLSSTKYKQLNLPFVDSNLQIKIANYLDKKTLKIDKEINLFEKKIKSYIKLKQTLINQTVTKGLNKNVEFKDSGIEWIGDIPKDWEVKRLKDFIKYTISGEVIDISYWNEGKELLYSAGKNPIFSSFKNFPNKKRTKNNDILIARNGNGFIHIPKLNSIFTNVVQLIRLTNKVNIKFTYYLLENIKHHINKISNGDFIASLNKTMWFNAFVTIPPKQEQIKIAKYLDEKTSKIDEVIETSKNKIKLLKEFRKTLINDVVIGKVKIK